MHWRLATSIIHTAILRASQIYHFDVGLEQIATSLFLFYYYIYFLFFCFFFSLLQIYCFNGHWDACLIFQTACLIFQTSRGWWWSAFGQGFWWSRWSTSNGGCLEPFHLGRPGGYMFLNFSLDSKLEQRAWMSLLTHWNRYTSWLFMTIQSCLFQRRRQQYTYQSKFCDPNLLWSKSQKIYQNCQCIWNLRGGADFFKLFFSFFYFKL